MNSITKLAELLWRKRDAALIACQEVTNKYSWDIFGRTDEEERQYISEYTRVNYRYDVLCEVIRDLNSCAVHGFRDGPVA